MIQLNYRLDPRALETLRTTNLGSADLVSLRYQLFCGDVVLSAPDGDLSAPWSWVPVLDFALAIDAIASTLQDGKPQNFEFTESEAAIRFIRTGRDVEISATYSRSVLHVTIEELRSSARSFLRRMVKELAEQNLTLAANPNLRPYLAG